MWIWAGLIYESCIWIQQYRFRFYIAFGLNKVYFQAQFIFKPINNNIKLDQINFIRFNGDHKTT